MTAVASRNVETAQSFVNKELKSDSSVKTYGTYDDLFADPVSEHATLRKQSRTNLLRVAS